LDNERCRIWIELVGREPAAVFEAKLIDLSRHGMQVQLAAPVVTGERVVLRIHDASDGLDVALAGLVRWQRAAGTGAWNAGSIFDDMVDYEVLGELFLRGILDMGRR
jgi:hypothetical protein